MEQFGEELGLMFVSLAQRLSTGAINFLTPPEPTGEPAEGAELKQASDDLRDVMVQVCQEADAKAKECRTIGHAPLRPETGGRAAGNQSDSAEDDAESVPGTADVAQLDMVLSWTPAGIAFERDAKVAALLSVGGDPVQAAAILLEAGAAAAAASGPAGRAEGKQAAGWGEGSSEISEAGAAAGHHDGSSDDDGSEEWQTAEGEETVSGVYEVPPLPFPFVKAAAAGTGDDPMEVQSDDEGWLTEGEDAEEWRPADQDVAHLDEILGGQPIWDSLDFHHDSKAAALWATDGDVEKAADLLLDWKEDEKGEEKENEAGVSSAGESAQTLAAVIQQAQRDGAPSNVINLLNTISQPAPSAHILPSHDQAAAQRPSRNLNHLHASPLYASREEMQAAEGIKEKVDIISLKLQTCKQKPGKEALEKASVFASQIQLRHFEKFEKASPAQRYPPHGAPLRAWPCVSPDCMFSNLLVDTDLGWLLEW